MLPPCQFRAACIEHQIAEAVEIWLVLSDRDNGLMEFRRIKELAATRRRLLDTEGMMRVPDENPHTEGA
jgi:hypothetical protein